MESREYTESYIAFLDMLGFKNLIRQSRCEDICAIFDNIKMPTTFVYQFNKPVIPQVTIDALKMKVMSDSICFYIDVNYPKSLLSLIISCLMFQANLLALPNPIFLRGAIVRGNMYAKNDVTFGTGLTQAYLMEEHNAKYPRIILTNEVMEYARQGNDLLLGAINDVWTFRDFDAFYALNSLKMFFYLHSDEKVCKYFRMNIRRVLDTTVDESIREKYLYLERVLTEHCSEKDGPHA